MTEQEVRQFDEAGGVTIETPLTAQEIANACAAFDYFHPCGATGERGVGSR